MARVLIVAVLAAQALGQTYQTEFEVKKQTTAWVNGKRKVDQMEVVSDQSKPRFVVAPYVAGQAVDAEITTGSSTTNTPDEVVSISAPGWIYIPDGGFKIDTANVVTTHIASAAPVHSARNRRTRPVALAAAVYEDGGIMQKVFIAVPSDGDGNRHTFQYQVANSNRTVTLTFSGPTVFHLQQPPGEPVRFAGSYPIDKLTDDQKALLTLSEQTVRLE